MSKKTNKIRVTLVKSLNGPIKKHQSCVRGLGLKRMHHTVEIDATPENMGMVNKVSYLLKIEEV